MTTKAKPPKNIDWKPGLWLTWPCMGCGKPLETASPLWRLCPDCYAASCENLACMLDKKWDRSKMYNWEDYEKAVFPLYGRLGYDDDK